MKTKAVLLVVGLLLVTVLVSGCVQQDTTSVDGAFSKLDQELTDVGSGLNDVMEGEELNEDIAGDLDIGF